MYDNTQFPYILVCSLCLTMTKNNNFLIEVEILVDIGKIKNDTKTWCIYVDTDFI